MPQDLADAELYALQIVEWLDSCQHKDRCPAAKLFRYLHALKTKNDMLEAEVARLEKKLAAINQLTGVR